MSDFFSFQAQVKPKFADRVVTDNVLYSDPNPEIYFLVDDFLKGNKSIFLKG
jgi:hypothetical protein